MGGRIASQIGAAGADVEGLVFLGYPLHLRQSGPTSAKHCRISKFDVVHSSSRDTFGTPDELRPIIKKLKAPAIYTLWKRRPLFKVLKRAGIAQDDAYKVVLDRIELWLRQTFAKR